MQKSQPLYKKIVFLANQNSEALPVEILSFYDDDRLVRVFIFRLASGDLVVEDLILD